MRSRGSEGNNIWLVTGAGLSLLAWLLPNHSPPWPAFYNEWVMAASMALLALWICVRWRRPMGVPMPALWILAVGLVPILQGALGVIEQRGDAAVAWLMLWAMAFAVLIGHHWALHAPQEAHGTLWTTLLAGGLISAGLVLAQWLRVDRIGVFLADLPAGARAAGNLAQANHMGTLMLWSLLGLWWLFLQHRLRPAWACCAVVLLLVAAAATQSRTVWLNLLILSALAAVWRRHLLPTRGHFLCAAGLLAFFVALVLVWSSFNQVLEPHAEVLGRPAAQMGPRTGIWRLGLEAVVSAPAWGWGWTQVNVAQQAVALDLPPLRLNVTYAHNLLLDLVIWNGVILGVLIFVALSTWLLRHARRVDDSSSAIPLLALIVLFVHALLEMPHAYAYFLLPAGLMAGFLEARRGVAGRDGQRGGLHLPRILALALATLSLIVIAVLFREYRTIEDRLERERFRAARVGVYPGPTSFTPSVLTQFERLWPALAAGSETLRGPESQRQVAQAARRFPSGPLQLKLALVQVRNGDEDGAARTLALACAMQRRHVCERVLDAWSEMAVSEPELGAIVRPTTALPRID